MHSDIRVRFAPSPTGYLHVGGARTALFNFLFAKRMNGTFILRIEDTDRSRYSADAVDEIRKSLLWLGLTWDEGIDRGGEYGPYFQSERLFIYTNYIEQLLKRDACYRCFCTQERLTAVRANAEKQKDTSFTGYDRTCRDLSDQQVKNLLDQKMPHTIRLKVPLHEKISFHDIIRGIIEYNTDVLDDLVLLKSDGYPTYHLANVVDDHCMKISHILRGDEWITSTPRHILLYRALDWEPPLFAHLPIILSETGGKLSKRKGAASVLDYKNAGYLKDALVNFLALLGWAPGENRELLTMDQMVELFSLDKISAKAAVFDEKKLEWMNGHYLAHTHEADLLPELVPLWKNNPSIDDSQLSNQHYLEAVIRCMKGRAKKLPDLADNSMYFFNDPHTYVEKPAKKYFKKETIQVFKRVIDTIIHCQPYTERVIETEFKKLAEQCDFNASLLIHPTRLAVSGVDFGPGLFELLEILTKDVVIRRLQNAIIWIEENL